MAHLNHPQLGQLKGFLHPTNVRQFFNLPFAVAERFEDPILKSGKLSDSSYDATKPGPILPQLPSSVKGEFDIIQKELPSPQFVTSEKSGLNLVVTIPPEATADSKLPVFVWIHGGGFIGGSGNFVHSDHAALVALSSTLATPIIGVAINYRLGPLGFLTSTELSRVGITGNYGLKDQRVALEWVQVNIGGFGGDPTQVTLMGQSAGGVSTSLQLYSPKPLFKRAAAIGGTSLGLNAENIEFHDKIYPVLLSALKIDSSLPVAQKVRLLKEVPEPTWINLPPIVPSRPLVDGEFLPERPTFKDLLNPSHHAGKPTWLESILLTDSEADGHVLRFAFGEHTNIATSFANHLKSNLPKSAASKILSTYGIVPHLADSEALPLVLDILSAIGFYAPAVVYAKAFQGRSYLIHFDEKNPFPGPVYGRASHGLDVAYLFQNFNEHLGSEGVAAAKEFGKRLISFISGNPTWKQYDSEGTALAFVGGQARAINSLTFEGRKREIWEVINEVGGDKLLSVIFGYIMVKE